MKNLFELSEEEKNKIRGLHESYKSKPGTKIIWEQTEDVTLNKLNEKIKNVLLSNKNKVYQNVTVTISPKGKDLSLEFASQTNPNNTKIIDVPATNISGVFEKKVSNFNVTFETLKLSEVYSEIFDNDPTLYQLYNNDNSVKSQMDNAFVPLYIYSENNGRISISNYDNTRKNRKGNNKFVEGDMTTLDKFFNNAGADFGVGNSILAVGFGGIVSDLGEIKINKTGPVPPPEPPPVADSFEFVLEDNFIFDEINLTPEGLKKYNEKKFELQVFLKKIGDNQNIKGNTTISDIINTNVIIYGYASIDGDPNENITNAKKLYEPCRSSGNGSRKDYNMCLSQKRAEYIANDLNTFIGEIKLPDGDTLLLRFKNAVKNWAVGIGKGETSEFSGKKWPETKGNTSITAPDRRVVFTPKLVANIKE
jgi:outer membrane protein OmpA-like peptidoglycan-associated protein